MKKRGGMKMENKKSIPKFKIGEKVWKIERDLSIVQEKIVGYKEVDKKITYELDVRFCQGISEEELFKTKNKAEVKKKNFLDKVEIEGKEEFIEYVDYDINDLIALITNQNKIKTFLNELNVKEKKTN